MNRPLLIAALLVAGCPKKAEVETPIADGVRAFPEPLPERPFVMPAAERATLSNGLEVLLVPNHEVPLVDLRVVFRTGRHNEPDGQEGLGALTFDMLDEGAAGRTAAEIAGALKPLGGSVYSGAGIEAGYVAAGGPTDNLGPILDVWADVLLRPDFPTDAWDLLRTKRVAELDAVQKNPDEVARRVWRHITYGDAYSGRLETHDSLANLPQEALSAYHEATVQPGNAILLVGGDTDLETLLPLLEARLASWTGDTTAAEEPVITPVASDREQLFVVDMPGTSQSVLRSTLPIVPRTDPAYRPFDLGNRAFGGAFTARVNMNLREDKGWTYGARCVVADAPGPSSWVCVTSVQSDKTVEALQELRGMTAAVVGDAPITDDEADYFRSSMINSFQGAYETPGSLLGELQEIWVAGLPTDWLEQYVPSLEATSTADANAALAQLLQPQRVSWLVVGDLSVHRDALVGLGLPTIQLDAEGNQVAVLSEGSAE